ncbi:exonuclease domain-containing protein [Sutcliffiella rhizosphaerae]|uniref:3'-5' exonuclease DinG n=1 Tax=Sutcliffiella rhizosphaerae TaxID=2880967 RepID=A0ABM8YRI6_9BACI|nr:exonuclease domain-containing protein [Sutcliffiella rhizosphaerae]CAG9622623.1 3'-5' exonuclease DinG [Sutcliffiella rhizosphaerae]
MKQRYVVLDLETTGNSPKKGDKIIQVGAVLIENGEIVERFASFVNPECIIPPFIEQLTNITQQMVDRAPTFKQIAPMLNEMLHGSSLVAHNVPFDLSFLQYELTQSGYPSFTGNTFDTVELSRVVLPTLKSYKLTDLSQLFQLDHDSPHRADSDAEATATIFLKLLGKIAALPTLTQQQLHTLLRPMKSDIFLLFKTTDKQKDTTDYLCIQQKLVIKKPKEDNIQASFPSLTGELENLQKESAEIYTQVENLFESRQHGFLEFTGNNGLHYALGALRFALNHKQKVVICTGAAGTKHLLEKTLNRLGNERDLFTEIKGKYYYLSLSKFLLILEDEDNNYDMVLTKSQILVWLTETKTGDLQELSLSSGGRLLWDSINCSRDNQRNEHDTTFCFYELAKNRLQNSLLIYTNHAFLAKEIHKPELFSQIKYFVVDDAHIFHHQVSSFFGKQISYLDIYFALSRLEDVQIVQEAKEELDEVFRLIRSYCLTRTRNKQTRIIYPFNVLKENTPGWFAVQEASHRFSMKLKEVLIFLEKQINQRVETSKDVMMLDTGLLPLKKMRATFDSLMFEPNKSNLTWFEIHSRGAKNSVSIYEHPSDTTQILSEKFYQEKSSVLFISPALSVGGDFEYISEELGLTDFYPQELNAPSQVLPKKIDVYIPSDMPLIKKGDNSSFIQAVSMQLLELIQVKEGRILVSFSSIEMMYEVSQELKSYPNAEEFVIVSQGSMSGSKQKIWKTAANFNKSILLVTNSFLEEISFLDEKVDTLVLIRLPFKAMEEPVMAAKIKEVEQMGRNSFTDVSLPVAVLRFKKIINSFILGNDPKAIFIFDKRVIERRYGDTFLESIPNKRVIKESFFTIIDEMT